jgi:hypothetical protein
MRSKAAVTCLACLLITATVAAQYGHPLKGTWSGDWGTGKDNLIASPNELERRNHRHHQPDHAVPLKPRRSTERTVRFEAESRWARTRATSIEGSWKTRIVLPPLTGTGLRAMRKAISGSRN